MNWLIAIAEIANEKGASFRHNQEEGFTEWTSGTIPTDAEINEKITELQNAEPMRLLREERDRRIMETDWWAGQDLTMTQDQKDYRQALRDLPSSASPKIENGQLTNVTWPTKPE